MIIATFKKREGHIIAYKTEGHANYAESGGDIICAAVSALVISFTNGLINHAETEASYEIESGLIDVEIFHGADATDVMTRSLLDSLRAIEKDYPDNVKVEVEKV